WLSPTERALAVRAALALRRVDPRNPVSDQQTFGSWLASHGQSPRAVRALWDLIGLPTLNLPASQASLSLGAKVFRTGLLERADAADIGVPLIPLSELHGIPALQALRAAGADVRLGAKAVAVLSDPDGVRGVALNDGTIEADAAVVAVPRARAGTLPPAG